MKSRSRFGKRPNPKNENLFQPGYWWDYSAPTLTAELVLIDGFIKRFRVYCPHCMNWNYRGPSGDYQEYERNLRRIPSYNSLVSAEQTIE